MKRLKGITLLLVVLASLLASCKKSHYDVGNVHGVNAEGEVLLPLASGSYSLMDLMQRFQIDSLIDCNASGDMTYAYFYERYGAVRGEDLLRFKDWNYEEHFVVENSGGSSQPFDTVVSVSQVIAFEADHIRVVSATIQSGSFHMSLTSNVGSFGEVLVTSSDIKDADGNDLSFVYQPQMGMTGFSFEGMEYHTDEANTLHLNYEIHLMVSGDLQVPEVEIDAFVSTTDLVLSEMRGYVDPYDSRDRIDTVFSLFPENMSGSIKVDDALITVSERNTFSMAACLKIDTALVWGEHIPPYELFTPMPLVIDMPSHREFTEVYRQPISGWIDAHQGHAWASSLFTVNSGGVEDLVTVTDSCNIDVRVDVSIPFSFNVSDVSYVDTVNMKLNEIEMPDLIEELTLEITFNSTLPLELSGKFMLYDSEAGQVTDVLLDEATLIAASYDGQATTTNVEVVITQDKVENALRSDRIILCFDLDTDAHDVSLNANQGLDFFAKAKVKYDGVVESDNL